MRVMNTGVKGGKDEDETKRKEKNNMWREREDNNLPRKARRNEGEERMI